MFFSDHFIKTNMKQQQYAIIDCVNQADLVSFARFGVFFQLHLPINLFVVVAVLRHTRGFWLEWKTWIWGFTFEPVPLPPPPHHISRDSLDTCGDT